MMKSIMIIGSRKQEAGSRKQEAGSRKHYFDFLRVAACFAVIILHVAAHNFTKVGVTSLKWQTLNFYDGIARVGVPLFIMISGALFLNPNKDFPIRKIYSKYILKIAIVFIFWAFVYAVMNYAKTNNKLVFFSTLIRGHYHMWFLFMIIGLYMILPYMRTIAVSDFLTKYFLLLALIFTFILPELVKIISVFTDKYWNFAEIVFNNFGMQLVGGYSSYFLLGYFLDRADISTKMEHMIYFIGLIGGSMTVLMSSAASVFKEEVFVFYDNTAVNVLCESVAVFVLFKKHFTGEVKAVRILSQYSFGAYLVHAAVISSLHTLGLHSLTFNPVVSVPVIAVIVFVISFAISAILNHVPVLKKYIV